MFNTLKAKLGLGDREQAVHSIELAENEVQLWDEMDDETASVYGGGRGNRNRKISSAVVRQVKNNRAQLARRRASRNNQLVIRNLPPGANSARYRIKLSKPTNGRRTKTTTNTTKNSFSSANSFNF